MRSKTKVMGKRDRLIFDAIEISKYDWEILEKRKSLNQTIMKIQRSGKIKPSLFQIEIGKYGSVTKYTIKCKLDSPYFVQYREGKFISESKSLLDYDLKKELKEIIKDGDWNSKPSGWYIFTIGGFWFEEDYGIQAHFQVSNKNLEEEIKPDDVLKAIDILSYIHNNINKNTSFVSQGDAEIDTYRFSKVSICPECFKIRRVYNIFRSKQHICKKSNPDYKDIIVNNPPETTLSFIQKFISVMLTFVLFILFAGFILGPFIDSLNSIIADFLIYPLMIFVICFLLIWPVIPSPRLINKYARQKIIDLQL